MLNKQHFETIVTAVMALCAVIVAVTVGHREFFSAHEEAANRGPVEVGDWRNYAVGDQVIGRSNAPVTIVEFADYQCSFCVRLYPVLKQVIARHPADVRLVFRNLPIPSLHPYALDAALAAECAAAQGQFGAYHDALFEHPDSLNLISWATFADRAGIQDIPAFESCRQSQAVLAKLHADTAAAARLGVSGTPTLLVNKWKVEGAPTADSLERLVVAELSHRR